MPGEDLDQTIEDATTRPKRAAGDEGSAEQFDLSELIEVDRYLAGKRRQGPGFRVSKIVPGGAAP